MTKRFLPILVVLALALVAPGAASAKITELGASRQSPAVKASCGPNVPSFVPANLACVALSRTTGFQGRAGDARNPFVIPSRGKIVAFSVSLGDPSADQLAYFTSNFGSTASARLSILRPGKTKKTRKTYRLLRQSPVYKLNAFFGSTPQFALAAALPVTTNYVVAITSPSWAPLMGTYSSAGVLTGRNWWRASRTRKADANCRSITRNAAVQKVNSVTAFACDYFGVRLMYTATFIPDPKPTKGR